MDSRIKSYIRVSDDTRREEAQHEHEPRHRPNTVPPTVTTSGRPRDHRPSRLLPKTHLTQKRHETRPIMASDLHILNMLVLGIAIDTEIPRLEKVR
jgi:hypothetical protein